MGGEKPCPVLVHFDKECPFGIREIEADLETAAAAAKISTMKRVIAIGDAFCHVHFFDAVVRYILPSEDCTVQKLLLLYLEMVWDKRDHDCGGALLLPVLCRHLQKNLSHPNEYLRGVTLRFLCRLRNPDLLEPLAASVRENLSHPHHFVRRHAFSVVYAVYRLLPSADRLLPDAAGALAAEQDAAARRNAFLFLRTCEQDRAAACLLANADRVSDWPDLVQMVAVELIPAVIWDSPGGGGGLPRYVRIIASLLSSPINAVVYECACTLMRYPSTALQTAAANAFRQLLASLCYDDLKLAVLGRLHKLCTSHRDVIIVDPVVDVLLRTAMATPCPSVAVRMKVLSLVLDLVTPRKVEEFVLYIKKEVGKTARRVPPDATAYDVQMRHGAPTGSWTGGALLHGPHWTSLERLIDTFYRMIIKVCFKS